MPFCVDDKLGPYEILAPISVGGMGEVYGARDPRMGCEVAIKVSAGVLQRPLRARRPRGRDAESTNICHFYESHLLPTGDIASYCRIGGLLNGTCSSDIRLNSAHSA